MYGDGPNGRQSPGELKYTSGGQTTAPLSGSSPGVVPSAIALADGIKLNSKTKVRMERTIFFIIPYKTSGDYSMTVFAFLSVGSQFSGRLA